MSSDEMTQRRRRYGSPSPLLAQLLLAAVGVVVGATILLSLWWLPSAPNVDRNALPRRNATALTVRDIQTGALGLVALTGAITAALAAFGQPYRRSRAVGALALATVALAGALFVVRRAVLWDQLALWAVTTDFEAGRGFWWPARSGSVRFVLRGGAEVSKGEYLLATIVHTVVVPALMLATATGTAWLSRRRPDPAASDDHGRSPHTA